MTAGKDGIIQIYTTEIEELLQIAKSQIQFLLKMIYAIR
jgi:hypothetical protein